MFVISWQFLFWVFSWLWDDRSLYHLHCFQWPVKLFNEFNTHSPGSISAVLMFLQINVILYLHPTTNISNKIMRFLLLKLNIQQSLKTYSLKRQLRHASHSWLHAFDLLIHDLRKRNISYRIRGDVQRGGNLSLEELSFGPLGFVVFRSIWQFRRLNIHHAHDLLGWGGS